jgi:hypothetical protein
MFRNHSVILLNTHMVNLPVYHRLEQAENALKEAFPISRPSVYLHVSVSIVVGTFRSAFAQSHGM